MNLNNDHSISSMELTVGLIGSSKRLGIPNCSTTWRCFCRNETEVQICRNVGHLQHSLTLFCYYYKWFIIIVHLYVAKFSGSGWKVGQAKQNFDKKAVGNLRTWPSTKWIVAFSISIKMAHVFNHSYTRNLLTWYTMKM